jgi:hypothetical protein
MSNSFKSNSRFAALVEDNQPSKKEKQQKNNRDQKKENDNKEANSNSSIKKDGE